MNRQIQIQVISENSPVDNINRRNSPVPDFNSFGFDRAMINFPETELVCNKNAHWLEYRHVILKSGIVKN